jgi:hypothetical protein
LTTTIITNPIWKITALAGLVAPGYLRLLVTVTMFIAVPVLMKLLYRLSRLS